MLIKKNPKADLEAKRGLFFEIGLLVTLLLVALVFGIGSRAGKNNNQTILTNDIIASHTPIEFIEIPNFAPPRHKPVANPEVVAVPVIADVLTIVPNSSSTEADLSYPELDITEKASETGASTVAADLSLDEFAEEDLWDEEIIDEDTPMIMTAEAMPTFDNGDLNTFRRWVASQFKYPENARQEIIQGVVTVQFYVEKDGSISNITVLSSPHEVLSREVWRVISNSPRWAPGIRDGKLMKFKYIMDVDIRLTRN